MNSIQKLHDIAVSLRDAHNVIRLAESLASSTLRASMEKFFENFDFHDELEEFIDDGDIQASTLLTVIEGAKEAFFRGDTRSIRVDTSHFDNDCNGNDHTGVTFTFSNGLQIASLYMVMVETRDRIERNTELSDYNDVVTMRLNDVSLNEKLATSLIDALEPVAAEIINGEYSFVNMVTSQNIDSARALIAKYQPLLDIVEQFPSDDLTA